MTGDMNDDSDEASDDVVSASELQLSSKSLSVVEAAET